LAGAFHQENGRKTSKNDRKNPGKIRNVKNSPTKVGED